MANKKHLAILKEGVDVWNKWRKENPHIVPDLKGANLFKEELQGINLSNADIRSTNFAKTNLTEANFESAKAGVQKWQIGYLLLFSWLFSTISCIYILILSVGINRGIETMYSNVAKQINPLLEILLFDFIKTPLYDSLQITLGFFVTLFLMIIMIIFAIYGAAIASSIIELILLNKFFQIIYYSF